jgi:hypothetical protein
LAIQPGMAALLARANSFHDLFSGEGFYSLGHPAGHGSSVGQSQLIPDLVLRGGFDSLGNPASSWVYHLLSRDNLFPDLFLGEGFDSLGHPAGHGSTVGQSQLIS